MARKERFSIGLSKETKEILDDMAKSQNRSLANVCETLIESAINESECFMDILSAKKKSKKDNMKPEQDVMDIEF